MKKSSIKTKVIIDNLKDIHNDKVNPIIELLKPFKSNEELIGNICKTNIDIEKINFNNLNNLEKANISIATNLKNLSKQNNEE